MKKENKEIIKLTAKEILKTLFDIPVSALIALEKKSYSASIEDFYQYRDERENDRYNIRHKIHYLKQQGLINTFVENKERFIELTPKGIKRLKKNKVDNLKIEKPKKWDGRFRMVIFDIPEKDRPMRDGVRHALDSVGFKQIQKSVFVFPFECKEEIEVICSYFSVKKYLKYLVADIIEGEEDIIRYFLDFKILNKSDIDIIDT